MKRRRALRWRIAGAGGSADLLPGPGEVATDPAHNPGAKKDVLADEEVRLELLHAESDDAVASV